jgi:hypothetical protein
MAKGQPPSIQPSKREFKHTGQPCKRSTPVKQRFSLVDLRGQPQDDDETDEDNPDNTINIVYTR